MRADSRARDSTSFRQSVPMTATSYGPIAGRLPGLAGSLTTGPSARTASAANSGIVCLNHQACRLGHTSSSRGKSHSTHEIVLKIAYAEHPLHGSVVYVCRRIRTDAGEMAIVETSNGLRRELPAWMLDAGYCAALTHGPAVVALPALQDLRVLLDSRLLDQRQSVDAESRAKENSPHGQTKTPQACSESPVAVPRPGGRVAAARGDVAGGRPRARRSTARKLGGSRPERRRG